MKYLKMYESLGELIYILWYSNENAESEILGLYPSKKDLEISILNHVNEFIMRADLEGIEDRNVEQDENGDYIFIDAYEALSWYNEINLSENSFVLHKLNYDNIEVSKPEIDARLKDYLDLRKYNL